MLDMLAFVLQLFVRSPNASAPKNPTGWLWAGLGWVLAAAVITAVCLATQR